MDVSAKFKRCDVVKARWEGGYANHPRDPGKATMRGVIQATYDSWRRKKGLATRHVRLISDAEVQAIYLEGYWAPVRGEELPVGLDLSVYDYGVNSGPPRSIKDLQGALGLKRDGVFGPLTLAAVLRADPAKAVKAHCGRRLGFLQSLAIWDTFGKGWGSRVADVQARGVAWALEAVSDGHVVAQQLEDEAAQKKKTADNQGKGAGAAGTAGAGSVATDQATSQIGDWLLSGIGVLVLAAAGYLVLRMVLNRQQAAAFRREVVVAELNDRLATEPQ